MKTNNKGEKEQWLLCAEQTAVKNAAENKIAAAVKYVKVSPLGAAALPQNV